MQGTWVQLLVWEDSTCCGAAKPVYTTAEARTPFAPEQEKPPQGEACAPQTESSPCSLQLEEKPCAATKTQSSQKIE